MCKRLFGVFCALLLLVAAIGGRSILPAFAATSSYTSPLEDLQKDSGFNVSDYPDNAKDCTIQVIQIAESTDGELFVYTYQPCQKTRYLVATEINMSLSESVNGTEPYALKLLSSDGVFCKYKVNGFTVSEEPTRYYNITSIYREWIKGIDGEAGNDNTVNEVSFGVGQIWTFTTSSDGVTCQMSVVDVITITSEMIGFRRYNDGFQFSGTKSCDAHFMAFNCDHKIDKLMSADIVFNTTAYKALAGSGTTYADPVAHKVTLRDYQVASNNGSGWFGKKEEWHRMTSTKEFVKEVEMTDKEKKELSAYDWILNFYETDYVCEAGGKDVLITALIPFGFVWTIVNACTTTGEIVSDVSLLRLEYDYNDEIYNLGMVSAKQTGSEEPTNTGEKGFFQYVWNCIVKLFTGTANFVEAAVAVIAILIVLVLLPLVITLLSLAFPAFGAAIKAIFKGLWTLLVWLFKGLWWLISAPFKGIAALVRKCRGE